MNVLALDPGGTTGYATLQSVNTCPVTPQTEYHIHVGQFPEYTDLHKLIPKQDFVVIEEPFHAPANKVLQGRALNPVVWEVFGAAKALADYFDVVCIGQPATTPHFVWKRYSPGNVVKSSSQHKKDAFAHLMFFLTHSYHVTPAWTPEQIYGAYQKGILHD